MAEYIGGKEKLVNVDEPIIFENKTDSNDELVEKRMNELKPCPFCGNEVNVEKIPLWYGNGRGYSGCYEFKIKCDNCGCTVDQPKNDSIYRSEEKARENAIKAWNRRVKNECTCERHEDTGEVLGLSNI